MLSVTPTFNKPWTLCSSLTEFTASPLSERAKRAHINGPKRVPSRRLLPAIGLRPHSEVRLGVVVLGDFPFRQ